LGSVLAEGLETIAAQLGLVLVAVACLAATFWDVKERRIPDVTCVAVVVGGSIWALLARHSGATWISVGLAVLILLVGTWVYKAKVWGGGDVKFLASIVLWLPHDEIGQFILFGAIGSFLTALIVQALAWRSGNSSTVPMAIAFLCGVAGILPHLLARTA